MQIGIRGSLFSNQDIQPSLDLGYEVVTTDQMLDGGLEALARRILDKFRGHKASCPSTSTSSIPPLRPVSRRRRRAARRPARSCG